MQAVTGMINQNKMHVDFRTPNDVGTYLSVLLSNHLVRSISIALSRKQHPIERVRVLAQCVYWV